MLAASVGGVAATAGATAISAGGAACAEGVTTGSAGGVATAGGVTAVSAVAVTVVAAGATGMISVCASVLVVVTGAAGVVAVSEGVTMAAVGTAAAAAAAQCSEIMFNSVTAKLLSAAAELAPLALCPMRVTSWPRCCLKSTLLVVILKRWPVPSSTTV